MLNMSSLAKAVERQNSGRSANNQNSFASSSSKRSEERSSVGRKRLVVGQMELDHHDQHQDTEKDLNDTSTSLENPSPYTPYHCEEQDDAMEISHINEDNDNSCPVGHAGRNHFTIYEGKPVPPPLSSHDETMQPSYSPWVSNYANNGNSMLLRDETPAHQSFMDVSKNEMVDGSTFEADDKAIDNSLFLPPLIVMDGANIAHAYAEARSHQAGQFTSNANGTSANAVLEPDATGIKIAVNYFLTHSIPYLCDTQEEKSNVIAPDAHISGFQFPTIHHVDGWMHGARETKSDASVLRPCRVLVVVPAHWLRRKPQPADSMQKENALMLTPHLETLQELTSKGLVCAAPPTDDDDAYVLAIARRVDDKQQRTLLALASDQGRSISQPNPFEANASSANQKTSFPRPRFGGAYVLSNDLFRDAIKRDSVSRFQHLGRNVSSRTSLLDWLQKENSRNFSAGEDATCTSGPGRISYTFCRIGGGVENDNEPPVDFMPNPRHPLVACIEESSTSATPISFT